MKSVVVYESLWGNTASIARAIAGGIGPDAAALTTAEATADALAGVDLIVAGAPVLGFSLPTDSMRGNLRVNPGKAPTPPDLSSPSMRVWLAGLGAVSGRYAAFETRLWWSPGGATSAIAKGLQAVGCRPAGKAQRFLVKGAYGPLRDGELDRARAWGNELASG